MNATLEAPATRTALQIVSGSPIVMIANNFATDEEVDHILRRAYAVEVRQPANLNLKTDATGFSFEMPILRDPILSKLADDIHAALGFANVYGQTMRFRRYSAGNSHPPHLDCYNLEGSSLLATAILYLDDADGGETHFPRAAEGPLSIAPRRGRLALWFNHKLDGSEDPASLHEGLVVHSGHKTTLTSFVYNSVSVLNG
jgi:prolyl 4-hydroxylase